MDGEWDAIKAELELARLAAGCDFAALAWRFPGGGRTMRWLCGTGSLNDKYLRMAVRPGVGLAGLALRVGKPVRMGGNDGDFDRGAAECPVMLSEKLVGAVAVPLYGGKEVNGILYFGTRVRDAHGARALDEWACREAGERIAELVRRREGRIGFG